MKITVTGSLGNISLPLTQKLIAAGHEVTVVSRDANKTADIEALGAKAAIGEISDTAFLTKAFTGADVIYTMVPPNFAADNYRRYVADSARSYVEAIKNAGVQRVVNLSSIGAHVDGGTGQISGVHDGEIIFNGLDNVAVKHVRAGFFYNNFYSFGELIKQGFMGSNYSADNRLVMVNPADIADAIAEELLNDFSGKNVRYITSDDRTVGEAVKILGEAIGKPDLKWVEFTDEQNFEGLLQAGMSQELARNFTEMGAAIRKGILWEDYDAKGTSPAGKTKLEAFAKEFAAAFKAEPVL